MASDISTSSTLTTSEEKRTVDESFLNKMKSLVERLRLENSTLKKNLDVERSGVRALKAQHEATLRLTKVEFRKKEEFLDKQLRSLSKPEKPYVEMQNGNSTAEVKKLASEIQSLKASNKCLQEKLKVAHSAESARAAELRAQAARHDALEHAARKDARTQVHKLLEEIKSKERLIGQLRRVAQQTPTDHVQVQRMECGSEASRKLRFDQAEKNNRDDLKTDIRHRKETFYREALSDADSAVSSAPPSLSPQPHNDMWSCGQCRAAGERAEAVTRECSRLTDALRDARDQLELLEFRLLELEDAAPDKGARENLTDSDSGCVSPGSRIKDSASPEFRRMDSGYKSPVQTPSSPCNSRRDIAIPSLDVTNQEDGRNVLAEILDKSCSYSDETDSLRSNPVKEHLEQMILNAGSAEDRSCLEQCLMLLYNLQAWSSSVSDDEGCQLKPKKLDSKPNLRLEQESPRSKIQKVATVSPYSQQSRGCKSESLESLCSDEHKKSNSILQESGIFEEVETEAKSTQTDVYENFECSGDLNTEIQRLNSIREKLEKQGVNRNAQFNSKPPNEEGDGLQCKCVKLGNKHKQYYERRLKFLEGKISIYEAAQDVKESKLAQRLQKEFILENRIQELELQLSNLQDKYERLEEDCCELEEIENDTRLHWQQLETDYELCSAQLRDMAAARECTRSEVERLLQELQEKECQLKVKEKDLTEKFTHLEKAVPTLIAWNMIRAIGNMSSQETALEKKVALRQTPPNVVMVVHVPAGQSGRKTTTKVNKKFSCSRTQCHKNTRKTENVRKVKTFAEQEAVDKIKIQRAMEEAKRHVDNILNTSKEYRQIGRTYDCLISSTYKSCSVHVQTEGGSELQESKLLDRVKEMEKREAAYLQMLTQADDMWAEMEGSYKANIQQLQKQEQQLKTQLRTLEEECERIKSKLIQKCNKERIWDDDLKVALDKAERDKRCMAQCQQSLEGLLRENEEELKSQQSAFAELHTKYKQEIESFRKAVATLNKELQNERATTKNLEGTMKKELDEVRKSLARSCRTVQELDVTNGELREEVESLEAQLTIMQKSVSQCKRKCEDKIKTLSHELSIKTEELEEMKAECMKQSFKNSTLDISPDRTEYIDQGCGLYKAVPRKADFGRMHHSLNYITSETQCSCPSMRSQLVGSLIEDLFERIHSTVDEDLTKLCEDIAKKNAKGEDTKGIVANFLLMAISKELVRSIGDADAKTDTEDWQRAVANMTYSTTMGGVHAAEGDAGVVRGAARLASVACACAAARLCATLPNISETVKRCQEEVLEHNDVKVMEEQLANAIESIVNCPSCALGTDAIVWSTDV